MNFSIRQIFCFSLLIKLALCLYIPVTLDEYYYFLWGKYLSLSYFDHPPMVGWIMTLSQPLKQLHEGLIRWPFILMSHGTLGLWILMLKQSLDRSRLKTFSWVALLNPLWGWGVFIATPDIPLLFFWTLSLFFCQKILKREVTTDYVFLGVSLGLGFLSKYQVALFLPCLLLMLWQQKKWHKLISLNALLGVVIAGAVCAPVFIWNMNHDWASIQFQWNHGMNFKYWKWTIPVEYILGQLFIVFPPFLFFFFQKKKDWRDHWLLPFATFPFLFFLYSSFRGRVEGNWVIMALPTLYGLSALYSNQQVWRLGQRTVAFWAVCFVGALGTITVSDQLPTNRIKLFEAEKFEPLIDKVDSDQTQFAYSYQLAAFLSFKTGHLICKFPKYGRPDHFQYIEDCPDVSESFHYLTEKNDNRPFAKDFPGFQVTQETSLGDGFKSVRVVKQ